MERQWKLKGRQWKVKERQWKLKVRHWKVKERKVKERQWKRGGKAVPCYSHGKNRHGERAHFIGLDSTRRCDDLCSHGQHSQYRPHPPPALCRSGRRFPFRKAFLNVRAARPAGLLSDYSCRNF